MGAGRDAAWERRVVDATGEGVLILTAEGICEYANPAAGRLLGWSRTWLVGQDAHALLHPGGGHDCWLQGPFHDALPVVQRDTFATARGRGLPVEVVVDPGVCDGLVDTVVCLFSDATERVRQERATQELLAARAAAVVRLEELAAQQRDFVSVVSHELRTPLTSIMGFLEMAREDPALSADTQDLLAVVDRNSRRLLAQVEALLLVSRLESGVAARADVPVDLTVVIAEAVDAVRTQAGDKLIRLVVDVPDRLPMVCGDPGQLDRVLLNLLSNAVKFTPSGGEVSLHATTVGRWLHVQVVDTGIGIPAKDQPRLFERFFRSTISQQKATPGTGLGLAIVKAIVEGHGGRIAVTSEEGVGTAVALTLPVAPAR